jgi:hypothetical protein
VAKFFHPFIDIASHIHYNIFSNGNVLNEGGTYMEKKIITISREFGSGGRTIGRMVAERLGIPFYDKELVDQIAV